MWSRQTASARAAPPAERGSARGRSPGRLGGTQQVGHLLAQPVESLRLDRRGDAGTRDQDVVGATVEEALLAGDRLAQTALDAVAVDGPAHPAGDGVADASLALVLAAPIPEREVAAA